MNNTWIVVPAHNEEKYIDATLHDIRAAGFSNIIVVDDGSSDYTKKVAKRLAKVISHPVSRGYGAALTTGLKFALSHGADYIVHFDGDGQFDAQEIKLMLSPLIESEADIVFGSRYLDKQTKDLPLSKKYLIHYPALLLQQIFLNMHFTDIHNGFRAMTRNAALKINVQQDRMAYASEIISEVKKSKLRYKEVPVTIAYREYGQGFLGGIKIYIDLLTKKLFK